MVDTLVNNKAELAAVAPHLQEFSAVALHKKFNTPSICDITPAR